MQDFFFTLTQDGRRHTIRVRANSLSEARAQARRRFPNAGNTLRDADAPGGGPATTASRPVGAGGAGGDEPNRFNTLLEREIAEPAAAVRSFLGQRDFRPGGVVGNALERAAAPSLDIRSLLEATGGGVGTQGFQEWLGNVVNQGGGLTRSLGQQASGALGNLAGLGGAGNALQQQFINPTSFGTEGAQAVTNTALAALGGQNPFLANFFRGGITDELQRRFGDQAMLSQQPGNFAQFLQGQLGLR